MAKLIYSAITFRSGARQPPAEMAERPGPALRFAPVGSYGLVLVPMRLAAFLRHARQATPLQARMP